MPYLTNIMVQSRFAETRFAETLTRTPTPNLNPNPNFGKSGFGESGRHQYYTINNKCNDA